MTADAAYRKITAEEFLAMDFGADRRMELVDGAIYATTGGTRAHARVQANLMRFLGSALRGSGCRPYGADMGVRTGAFTVRYPDVSVSCDEPPDGSRDQDLLLERPRVLIEILSPGTRRLDEKEKLPEYRLLETVDTILLVDPESGSVRIVQRTGPSAWRDDLHDGALDVPLPALGVAIPAAEIFARD